MINYLKEKNDEKMFNFVVTLKVCQSMDSPFSGLLIKRFRILRNLLLFF